MVQTSGAASSTSLVTSGNVAVGGTLTASGAANLNSGLTVFGATSLQNATATNGFNVSGSSLSMGNNFVVNTAGNASTTQLTVSGTSNFGGAATFQSTITQQGTGIVSFGGNVGIGTTTPNNLLSLFAATNPALGFTTTGGVTGWSMGLDTIDGYKFKIASSTAIGTNTRLTIDAAGNVGIASSSPSAVLSINNPNPTSNTPFLNISSTTTSFLYVNSIGKVGVGTTAPQFTLAVNGTLHVTGQCVVGNTKLVARRRRRRVNVNGEVEYYYDEPEEVEIKDIKSGDLVLSLNEKTGAMEFQEVRGLMDMGVKPVFKVTTESGRTIITTGNHPYRTKWGWRKVMDLTMGDEILVVDLRPNT